MVQYEFSGDSQSFATAGQNRSTWETCRLHREIVTKRIALSATENGKKSLCVFGAGPCNDIDLNVLSKVYPAITLVDKDKETLASGLAQQNASSIRHIESLDDVDLFGVSDLLTRYHQTADETLVEQILETVASHQPNRLGTYDCVASTCMLSQLLCEAAMAIPTKHFHFVNVLKAIRLRHVKLMFDSLEPGGTGILVTDIVSSESLPDLLTDKPLKPLLQHAIANQNFLHGLNPEMVASVLRNEAFANQLASVRVSDPWRWVLPERTYACFAIEFTRS